MGRRWPPGRLERAGRAAAEDGGARLGAPLRGPNAPAPRAAGPCRPLPPRAPSRGPAGAAGAAPLRPLGSDRRALRPPRPLLSSPRAPRCSPLARPLAGAAAGPAAPALAASAARSLARSLCAALAALPASPARRLPAPSALPPPAPARRRPLSGRPKPSRAPSSLRPRILLFPSLSWLVAIHHSFFPESPQSQLACLSQQLAAGTVSVLPH
ncbi:sterile alpha motif domain-containing protein 1-like [Marmota flaviventris]|uniref:sterile alpha motif domain-containing protein 1-like n=1 Tax=Marmota flaviventris TaxID=93162 RepID=UPI003A85BB34